MSPTLPGNRPRTGSELWQHWTNSAPPQRLRRHAIVSYRLLGSQLDDFALFPTSLRSRPAARKAHDPALSRRLINAEFQGRIASHTSTAKECNVVRDEHVLSLPRRIDFGDFLGR